MDQMRRRAVKRRPLLVMTASGSAYEGGGRYELHPTIRCPQCGSALMLGDKMRNLWHCTNLDIDTGDDWLRHFEASRDAVDAHLRAKARMGDDSP